MFMEMYGKLRDRTGYRSAVWENLVESSPPEYSLLRCTNVLCKSFDEVQQPVTNDSLLFDSKKQNR